MRKEMTTLLKSDNDKNDYSEVHAYWEFADNQSRFEIEQFSRGDTEIYDVVLLTQSQALNLVSFITKHIAEFGE